MSRSLVFVTLALTAMLAFLVGLTTGSVRAPALPAAPVGELEPPPAPEPRMLAPAVAAPVVAARSAIAPGMVNFADVAESINPAVVNIEATSRTGGRRRRAEPMPFDGNLPTPPGPSPIRPQSGS